MLGFSIVRAIILCSSGAERSAMLWFLFGIFHLG